MKNCTRSLWPIAKWAAKSLYLILFVFSFGMQQVKASSGTEQTLQEVTIDLTLRDRSLKDALSLIKKKTGFKFVYK